MHPAKASNTGPPSAPPAWAAAQEQACRTLVALALDEDLGTSGDRTSQLLIPESMQGRAKLVAREAGVVSGLHAAQLVFSAVDPGIEWIPAVGEGACVCSCDVLAVVSGPMRGVLAAERTALNFLQRLSGIARLTREFVAAVAGLPVLILDTRKTTPGWRILEKYAVRCGGGHNHRLGLHDAILIKDNHLAALRAVGRGLAEAVAAARASGLPVEVEVDSLESLDPALAARPDIVLLDNMSPAMLADAVARRNRLAPAVELEASGGVRLETVRAIAETGVDRISVGALTHSAKAMDIALDYDTGTR